MIRLLAGITSACCCVQPLVGSLCMQGKHLPSESLWVRSKGRCRGARGVSLCADQGWGTVKGHPHAGQATLQTCPADFLLRLTIPRHLLTDFCILCSLLTFLLL